MFPQTTWAPHTAPLRLLPLSENPSFRRLCPQIGLGAGSPPRSGAEHFLAILLVTRETSGRTPMRLPVVMIALILVIVGRNATPQRVPVSIDLGLAAQYHPAPTMVSAPHIFVIRF